MTELIEEKGRDESEKFGLERWLDSSSLLAYIIAMMFVLTPFFVIFHEMVNGNIYNLNSNEILVYEHAVVNVDGVESLFLKSNRSEYKASEKDHDVEYIVGNRHDGKLYNFNSQCFIDENGRFKQFIHKDGTDLSGERLKEIEFTFVKNSFAIMFRIYTIGIVLVLVIAKVTEMIDRKRLTGKWL